jgi:hypothetical protein
MGRKPQDPRVVSLQDRIQRGLEHAESPNAPTQRRINELFSEISGQGIRGWAYLADCLFFAITRHHGDAAARDIFDAAGPMPKRLRNALANATLLDRLARMKPKPNRKALARELAKEAGRADDPGEVQRFYDHIRDLQKALKKWRAKHPLPGGH